MRNAQTGGPILCSGGRSRRGPPTPGGGGGHPGESGVVTWIGYGPIYCAAANGSYQKYGLDVKLVNFSDNSVMPGALQSGQIDATTLTYDQVIASNARGWKLKVVMPSITPWAEMPFSRAPRFRRSRT